MSATHTPPNPFVDAQQMAVSYPETFEAPDRNDLDAIEPGVYVKVCTGGERFWIHVTRHLNQFIEGTVANKLIRVHLHGLDIGDLIVVEERHIFMVLTPVEMERLREEQ